MMCWLIFLYRSVYRILYENVFNADHTTCEAEASAEAFAISAVKL